CSYTNFSVTSGSATLSPGTYCNGITISGGANVTFTAGTYIMMGGGLKASSSATLNGTGVTFFLSPGLGYNYCPLSITGSSSIRLKAPTTDPYYGILFYQDPSIGAGKPGSTITGNADMTEGVFYFPTTSLSYSGNSEGNAGNYLILVADTITVTGSAYRKAIYPSRSPLSPPIAVSVTPATGTLYDGQSQQFTATVSYSVNTALTWTVSPAGAGTISSAGLYTAPASITSQQAVTITATSQADTTKSATATITFMPPVGVTVAPATATLYGSQSQQFTSTVTNTANPAVTWSITPSGVGTISATGLYTAPASITTQQTVTVRATSQADTTKSATATVTLLPPVSVTVSPVSATLYGAQTQQFAATVANTGNTAVTWSISPAGVGAISSAGLYTAPASISSQQTVTVTATSQADNSKTASATVT